MADDILGHEHLEHGRHLHKRKQRPGRPSHLPFHIALRQEPIFKVTGITKILFVIVAAAVLFVLFKSARAIIFIVAALVINTIIEQHKVITQSIPLDLEILSASTAFIASTFGIFAALPVVIAGPLAKELSHGHLSEFVYIKIVALFVTALAASVIGSTPMGMFVAVLLGLATQYLLMQSTGASAVMNFLRRLTCGAFNGYIIFALIPLLQR